MNSIFKVTQEALDNQLHPAMEAAVAKRFAACLPVIYRDERFPTTAHFMMPKLYVIAGPNGAGKSTFTHE